MGIIDIYWFTAQKPFPLLATGPWLSSRETPTAGPVLQVELTTPLTTSWATKGQSEHNDWFGLGMRANQNARLAMSLFLAPLGERHTVFSPGDPSSEDNSSLELSGPTWNLSEKASAEDGGSKEWRNTESWWHLLIPCMKLYYFWTSQLCLLIN